MMLKYAVKKKYIVIEFRNINENKKVVALLSNFLHELSKDQKVFVHTLQLLAENTYKLFNKGVVLKKASKLLDSADSYFYLSEAKIDLNSLAYTKFVSIYYCNKAIEWQDFLATSEIRQKENCIKSGVVSTIFSSNGFEYSVICNRVYEQSVMQFIREMNNLGFESKRSFRP